MADSHMQFESQAQAPPAYTEALRIVLFGMPDAGKSSLLGALAQAAQTQERTLGGRLTDVSHGLAELQHRLYDERPRETLDEIVPYPVTFDPLDGAKPDPSHRAEAVFVDCDGRVANRILTSKTSLAGDARDGTLAAEVLSADALLLVVDAGASAAQVETDLGEAVRFLRLFQRVRGRRSDVGGLPIFLVLSKCDLLAQSGDVEARWLARVEARKEEVGRQFRTFLQEDNGDDDRLAFGVVDLELAATAVKRPELSAAPARPREPWGVAELFHQALEAARAFRTRRVGAQRRLMWTVGGAITFFAALAAFAGMLVLNREAIQSVALTNKVESYRAREGLTASTRLSEPLQRKLSELSDLAADREFPKLSAESQQYLTGRLKELEAYLDYKERLQRARPPADARNTDELHEIEQHLLDDLALPKDYQADWRQTEAALFHDKWSDDVKAIRQAMTEVESWYRVRTADGDRLLLFADRTADNAPLPWAAWTESVAELFRRSAQPPFRTSEKLRDSRAVPGARAVTYETVLRFPNVDQARAQWDRVRQQLENLRDVTLALGLSGDGTRALLKISDTPRFTAGQAGDRLRGFKEQFPRSATWSLTDLPDAAAPEVRQAAQASYQRVLQAGRAVVRDKAQQIAADGSESVQRWRQIADWLPNAPELREWRELANLLLKLADPAARDPVTALAEFIQRPEFRIEVNGMRLTVPYELRGLSVRPVNKLTLYVQTGDKIAKLPLRLEPEGVRDARRRVTTYSFSAEGVEALPCKPGDMIWADVPLRDATGREWVFSWWGVPIRSTFYQTERLFVAPRLHASGQRIENGDIADGVLLTPAPEAGLPRVPDLLPAVR